MEELKNMYDVIIVGGGAGGLSVGCSLAKNGQKVLVVEKNDRPGGNCTSRKVGDYTFDLAVHQLTGVGGDKGQCGAIFEEYGVAEKLQLSRIDPFLVLSMPDRDYQLPGTQEGFREELVKEFPEDTKDIDRFLKKLNTMKQDSIVAQRVLYGRSNVIDRLMKRDVDPIKKITFPFTGPTLLLDANLSGDAFFRRYIKNEKLLSLLFASWPYLGLPPKQLSGVMQAFLVSGQQFEKTFYPIGSSQVVANAMSEVIQECGGRVLLNTEVKKIIIENKKATGIELPDGNIINAKIVICNAPARYAYQNLIDSQHVPKKFMKKLDNMDCSVGPFKVYLGLDYELSKNGMPNHEYLFYDSYDHEDVYERMSNGYPAVLSAYTPNVADPTLAPKGHSTLVMTIMVNWNAKRDWRVHRDEIAEEMIDIVAKKVPDIRDHIKVKHIFTPESLKNATNSTDGSMYGWANNPYQVLTRRFHNTSFIKNFFHVGHWSQPGTGVTVAVMSGWMLGNIIKKKYKRKW
ncbi:MAG: NAD(P)/FAD-dependent oxidoreductase [Saprospiraceae bacterium]|nr:NAD(P)/FAD-dependent oxidoreductase [Saprospiraceae bacterium]